MKQEKQPAGEPFAPDPVFLLRDDLAAHFKPVNAFERILLGAAAQAWLRYQQAQDIERRLFEKNDPLDLITKQPKLFNTVTRHVAGCERAWRRSLEEIRRAIRNREKTLASPNARRAADRRPAPPPLVAAASAPDIPLTAPIRRE